MESFQEIVTAYDKAKIDVMVTGYNPSYADSMDAFLVAGSSLLSDYARNSIELLLGYAFGTSNLEVIKYALSIVLNPKYGNASETVPFLVDQFQSEFEKYPRLNLYLKNLTEEINTEKLASENSYGVRRRRPLLSLAVLRAYLGDPTDLIKNRYPIKK